MAINFFNLADNFLYGQPNSQFITQERFRGNVAPAPQGIEEEEVTETFGIPATETFQSINNGDNNFSGYSYGLPGNFQQAVDARQERLNTPIDTSTFMGKAKDFMNPQSANQIMASGYEEPRFQPGIIGTIMGKMDNYRNLPQADQAFIAQNMGYTGPTVFGENNSGLGKDPFGINTRSAFGNYAQHSRDMAAKDGDLAETVADQEARGIFDTIQSKQLAFHQKKQKEELAQKKVAIANEIRAGEAANAGTQRGGGAGDSSTSHMGGISQSQADAVGKANKDAGMGGWGLKDGGRAGYFFGGRVNFKNGGLASIL